ncbi:MAG: hypothetical protein AB7O37_23725 [Vicinamibacteria bacterium]
MNAPYPMQVLMPVQRLPFTVRAVRHERELRKAVDVRQRAYGRHVPELGALLREPEPQDRDAGNVVLLAESRLDGAPLGTLRIQTNRHRPLALEGSVELPAWLAGASLAEATRLGVAEGRVGRMVKTMLFKALYLHCLAEDIDWMVIGARAPLDRMYAGLLFEDVFPGRGYVPLKHAGNLPHRILGFELASAEARWSAARHPLLELFVGTRHPDIEVGGRVPVARPIELRHEARPALAA